MLVVTTEQVAGYEIVEHLGTAIGSTIRARHLGKDIIAFLRSLVGGEVKEYTGMLSESRDQALERMVAQAREMGADAVVGVRFQTSMILQTTAELLAYGSAVRLRKV
jgi:uncharacterized protein YbjQ (UPF0145 family)